MNKKSLPAFIFGFAVLFFGAWYAFAGQVGIGGTPTKQHNHSGPSQGGNIQALKLTGNFQISGNNAGNINLSTAITGTNFIWKPSSAALIGGFANDDSFYVNNIGGYSWIGGYNTMSRGDYSLAFGTNVKNYRAASIALGYYLRNNAGNSVMIGSGPGYGGNAYAVNDDTGSIKFFPFTTTSETRPMLDMRRDNSAVAVGTWTFTNDVYAARYYGDGSHLTGITSAGDVNKASTQTFTGANTFSGNVTVSSLTVTGGASFTANVKVSSPTGTNIDGVMISSGVFSSVASLTITIPSPRYAVDTIYRLIFQAQSPGAGSNYAMQWNGITSGYAYGGIGAYNSVSKPYGIDSAIDMCLTNDALGVVANGMFNSEITIYPYNAAGYPAISYKSTQQYLTGNIAGTIGSGLGGSTLSGNFTVTIRPTASTTCTSYSATTMSGAFFLYQVGTYF